MRGSVSAPGIFFDLCPTGDLLGGALKMLDCAPSLQSALHNKATAVNSTTPNQRNYLGYKKGTNENISQCPRGEGANPYNIANISTATVTL